MCISSIHDYTGRLRILVPDIVILLVVRTNRRFETHAQIVLGPGSRDDEVGGATNDACALNGTKG